MPPMLGLQPNVTSSIQSFPDRFTNTSQPVTSLDTSQSFSDYAQVSGFYGPGTWAAWVITLVSSWILIFLGDYTHNLHFMSYALYTNWAAIDLLRRTVQKTEDTQSQSAIAALAVVRVGISNACLQIGQCLHRSKDMNPQRKRLADRRLLCIAIGLLLPVATNFLVVPYIYNDLAGHNTFSYIMLTVASAVTMYMVLGQNMNPANNLSGGMFWLYAFFPLALYYVVWGSMNDSNVVLMKRCSLLPCAPQAITEWDQAFSLIVALFLFFYEFGYRIYCIVVVKAADWLMSFLIERAGIFPVYF